MATIRVKFCPSDVADQKGSICYQIEHEKSVRLVISAYKIMEADWDEVRCTVKHRDAGGWAEGATDVNRLIRRGIRLDTDRLRRISRRFEETDMPYEAEDVAEEYERYPKEFTLSNFMGVLIEGLRLTGRVRTAETYGATMRSFRKFLRERHPLANGGMADDIFLDYITSEVMEGYEDWARGTGLVNNSISFYNRILRAVYNRAVDRRVIDDSSPFKHVYTGVEKTKKRALTITSLRKIKNLQVEPTSPVGYARDMFMLSFYLRGMSFVDMTYLRKSDLIDGSITYVRRKTGQRLTIRWTPEMQRIINRYPENPTEYLLPIIRFASRNERSVYRKMSYNINHNLKQVAKLAGLKMRLSMYVARHSWATVARAKGIPLSVISEGMGHESEITTRIYLASFEASVVDRANAMIIKSLD